MERFTEVLELSRYALYVFDYGAPVGFRLAMHHPERITALISQNGNAYEEGLSDGWNPIQAYWKDPSQEKRSALRAFLTPEATQGQYTHGVANRERLSPDAWTLDAALLARPGNDEIQLDLSATIRATSISIPNSRIISARADRHFSRCGARMIRFFCLLARSLQARQPSAEIHLLDAGHFALESRGSEIAAIIATSSPAA